MKSWLKKTLQKCPFIYSIVEKVYYNLRFSLFLEYIVGTKAREKEWQTRHNKGGNDWTDGNSRRVNDDWVLGYWASREHKHRLALVDQIASFSPLASVLEFGCNCGPNLYLLAKKYPEIAITGIDINESAIEEGKKLFSLEKISNVTLITGGIEDLKAIKDKSYDVVFTDAVLIYVGRDAIEQVVGELIRISRKGLVFVERNISSHENREKRNGLGVRRLGFWHRDYEALLKCYLPDSNITITKMTEELWDDPGWQDTGAFIRANITEQFGA
jgi:predicted O-methyltransferase YrrM